MTKYSVKYAQNYGIFKEIALFSEWIPDIVLVNFCDDLSNEIDNCTAVEALDLETGAIIYGIYEEKEPEDERLEFDAYNDDV